MEKENLQKERVMMMKDKEKMKDNDNKPVYVEEIK